MKTFHKPLPILSLLALLLVVVCACRKEKPAFDLSDKDPCSCASEVSADFDIFEAHNIGALPPFILTDHILSAKYARFTAKTNGAQYKWYLGSEILTSQSILRGFSNDVANQDIQVTLVVRKEPNLVCFPDDDGYDSITKTFHVYPRCMENYLMEGTFRVAEKNSTDSLDISFITQGYPPYFTCFTMDVTNFDGLGLTCPGYYFEVTRSYRYMSSRGGGSVYHSNCRHLLVYYAQLHLNGLYEIDFEYKEADINNAPYIRRKMFGRKLE